MSRQLLNGGQCWGHSLRVSVLRILLHLMAALECGRLSTLTSKEKLLLRRKLKTKQAGWSNIWRLLEK